MKHSFFLIMGIIMILWAVPVLGSDTIYLYVDESEDYESLLHAGDTAKVIDVFLERMERRMNDKFEDPNEPPFSHMADFLGSVFIAGQYDTGITVFNKFLEKHGNENNVAITARAITFRGILWEEKGQYDKAIEDYSTTKSFSDLAWLLATCPDAQYRDGQKALEYAKNFMAQSKKETAFALKILAAAYAETGNFPEAIKIQEKAISLVKEEWDKRKYEKQLASYKEGKPWRVEPLRVE